MKKLLLKLKKGFTIAEVVIAIAVISIISVSAVTTITLSVKNQRKNLRNHDIAFTCNTVIDCFRFGDLSQLSTIYENNYDGTTKTINRGSYKLYIATTDNTITLTAKDNNNNELHKVFYEKID